MSGMRMKTAKGTAIGIRPIITVMISATTGKKRKEAAGDIDAAQEALKHE